jgi:LmbE family N-acetylglucosaminyl deacetylase
MTRRSVLAVGAHPDDIELGCGGALAKHVAAGDKVAMLVVTRGEEGPGRSAQRVSEQLAAVEVLGVDTLLWGEGFLDCRVSLQEFELVHLIEDAIEQVSATVIYTHMANDSHQDHRVVSRCTMGAARWVSTIMAYGGPSAVSFNPTSFIDISDSLDKKIEALMCHVSQAEASEKVSASWVRSAAEHYGFLCRRPFAEGFEPIRQVVDF